MAQPKSKQWNETDFVNSVFVIDWDQLPKQIAELRENSWDDVRPSQKAQVEDLNFDYSIERRFGDGHAHAICWDIQFQDDLKGLWLSLHHSTKIKGTHLDQIATAILGAKGYEDTAPQTTLTRLGLVLSKTTVKD